MYETSSKGEYLHALVLAFGDLGHSPRMQNHVRELVKAGYSVDFAGYVESELPKDLKSDKIKVISIPPIRVNIPILPKVLVQVLQIFLKIVIQTLNFLWTAMTKLQQPNLVLVQSPPVLPTIIVGFALSKWYNAQYFVDWHNVGYTILAQSLNSPTLIGISKAIELYSAKLPDVNLVVSKTQQDWMKVNVGIDSLILYDRPDPDRFRRLDSYERKVFLHQIREMFGWGDEDEDEVPLIVSSTSWTFDEDFDILVNALKILNESINRDIQLIITGKGPMRQHYEEKFRSINSTRIKFATVWLSFEDYAKLLGSADIGICLHTSSSGVDLPMKAIDMIGAGLPVAAYSYTAIGELIRDGFDGFLFKNPKELAQIIQNVLFQGQSIKAPKLDSWSSQWGNVLLPALKR